MRRCAVALAAVLLSSLAPPAAQAGRRATELLQPSDAEGGAVLAVKGRRARVSLPGGARGGFRLRRDERLLGFSQLATGWIATGIRLSGDGVDHSLVANLGRGPRRLTVPATRSGAVRTAPVPVIDGGRLVGLAWLEGDLHALAVRAGRIEDGSFTAVETVSPAPPRGSQTGLTAAVLADGSWLLAWSRFDGRDDEIAWSRRRPGGGWSAPRGLTANAAPDVTPQLLARGSGALLAWSGLRQEYEVFLAGFDGTRWTEPRSLGVRGTLTPAFRRLAEADYLLVRSAWPGGWTAFRLDGEGKPSDFASVLEESRRPPVLRSPAGRGLAFEWAHRPQPEILSWEPVP